MYLVYIYTDTIELYQHYMAEMHLTYLEFIRYIV